MELFAKTFKNYKSRSLFVQKSIVRIAVNIKAQKDTGWINILENLEKSAKHEPECLLNHNSASPKSLPNDHVGHVYWSNS